MIERGPDGLPVRLFVGPGAQPEPVVYPWTCSTCGRHDSDGTHGPGEWHGEDAAYGYHEGPWLCGPCSRRAWSEHLRAVSDRLALIAVWLDTGQYLTRSQMDALRKDGVQLPMFPSTREPLPPAVMRGGFRRMP